MFQHVIRVANHQIANQMTVLSLWSPTVFWGGKEKKYEERVFKNKMKKKM